MANMLKIDFDQLNTTIADYEKSISDFQLMIKNLDKYVDALKNSGWDSAASKAYFNTYDETWKKNMEVHIKILDQLKDWLNEGKKEYVTLYDSIPSIGSSF